MLRKIRAYIEEYNLLADGKPVLVGLSGGADSVALMSVLCELGYSCVAAHCNFHLRAEESDRDEAFARKLAADFDVPFYPVDFDTVAYASAKQISTEMAARELRYQWFEELRLKLDAQAIAVAHHEQDNVETVLLNLVRGTGIRGLTGMQPKNGYIIRPLLAVKKEDILSWLEKKKINYVTDSTNLSDAYTRNFLRLNVIPLLEEINPSVSEAIVRTAANLADTEVLYRNKVEEILKSVIVDNHIVLIKPLLESPAPQAVLYEFLKRFDFNRSVAGDIFNSLTGESGKCFFSQTHHLIKDRDRLFVKPLASPDLEDEMYFIDETTKKIACPIKLSFEKEVILERVLICKDRNVATLDLGKLKFPLTLRHWKEGDWFIPFGMKGRKKLSDYFTDAKLSLFEKKQIWLICCGEKIVWIVGKRIDNRFCVEKKSKQLLKIHFFE